METTTIILRDKAGNIIDNNEIVYFKADADRRFPLKRVVRWALIQTNKLLSADCAGMEGEGDFGVDSFWNYFNEFYPQLIQDVPGCTEFEDFLIDIFEL